MPDTHTRPLHGGYPDTKPEAALAERYREALEWYADERNYQGPWSGEYVRNAVWPVVADQGSRARAALAQCQPEGEADHA